MMICDETKDLMTCCKMLMDGKPSGGITWQTINSIIGRGKNKTQQTSFKMDGAKNITDPKITTNAFNDFCC